MARRNVSFQSYRYIDGTNGIIFHVLTIDYYVVNERTQDLHLGRRHIKDTGKHEPALQCIILDKAMNCKSHNVDNYGQNVKSPLLGQI